MPWDQPANGGETTQWSKISRRELGPWCSEKMMPRGKHKKQPMGRQSTVLVEEQIMG